MNIDPSRTVVVRDVEEPLSFHNPDKFEDMIGLRETTAGQARENGAIGCSTCFAAVDCTDYQWTYMDGKTVADYKIRR